MVFMYLKMSLGITWVLAFLFLKISNERTKSLINFLKINFKTLKFPNPVRKWIWVKIHCIELLDILTLWHSLSKKMCLTDSDDTP